MQEGLEAGLRVPAAGAVVLPGEAGGGGHQAQVEVQAQFEAVARQQQAEQRQALEAEDDDAVGIAEEDGGGFHPDLQVVLAVGHCVVGVVGHRPQQVGDVQQPGGGRQLAGFGGEGHRHAPGEGGAQYHLRVEGVALHEGVAGGERQAAE
ncbi:hypothetical protein D9M69_498590 [compost metagenome]